MRIILGERDRDRQKSYPQLGQIGTQIRNFLILSFDSVHSSSQHRILLSAWFTSHTQNVFQILLPFSANVQFATGAVTRNSKVAKATSGTKRDSAKFYFATGAATRRSQVAKATTGTKRDYVQNSIATATRAIFNAIGNALGTKWKSTRFVQLPQFK